MIKVNEVSKITGASVRTLHHYDAIGLLKPTAVSEAGYRLYDDTALERLQQILLLRELEFSLREIKTILEAPTFDRNKALEHQITLLTLKKERLEKLIDLACEIQTIGVNNMNFTAFDTSKTDKYAAEVKAAYGLTDEYKDYEEKSKGRTDKETKMLNMQMTALFAEFGTMRKASPESETVQSQVKKLKKFISEHFFNCSDKVLHGLGKMYAEDERFTANIDKAGGKGTAEFVLKAIEKYCFEQRQ